MITRSITRQITRSIDGAITGGDGGSALPAPTTVNFTSAQFAVGLAGSISTTKNAARIYGQSDLTLWCGVITGTEAKLTVTSDYGANAGMIQVALDGGAFVNAPNVSSLYTLFTGQPHAARFVEIRFASGYGDAPYIAATGNVLVVTGQPPALSPVANWLKNGDDSSTGFASCAQLTPIATFSPPIQAGKGTTYGSNIGSAKIRGSFTKLYVSINGESRKIGVSKNGATPTFYSVAEEANKPIRAIVVPCDGSDSVYHVWDDGNGRTGGGHFTIAGNSARLDIGIRKRLDQYGDSITYGAGSNGIDATPADVDTMQVAAALGMVGSTHGISGYTIAQCKTLLDTVLPKKTVAAADVAVLAIGRNNVPTIDSTEQADYGLCIDKLLAAGYGKVLCRAILPTPNGSSSWVSENAALQAVVTAKANPNVIWIPTITWLGYASADNTHPTAAGYVTLAGYAVPAYTAALGL